jgi:hypothetical protein
MLPAWAALVALAAQAAQAPAPPPDPAVPLIEEIESLAAGEPPILGIVSQIRAAEVLSKHRPKAALRMLDAALARTSPLTDPLTQGVLTVDLVGALAPLDPTRAEETCATLPRRTPWIASCYSRVIRGLPTWPAQFEAVRRALSAGAYDLPFVSFLFDLTSKDHAGDLDSLFACIIDNLPPKATPAEAGALFFALANYGDRFPALSRAGLDKAYRAITNESEYAQFARIVQKIAPDLLESWPKPTHFEAAKPPAEKPKKKDDDIASGPEISKLSFDDALSISRAQERAVLKAAALLELLDREDIPEARRGPLALEALEASTSMEPGDDRLIAQSMLTRRLWDFGLKAEAGKAAAQLEFSFELLCRCRDATCDSLKDREDCAERVMDFAEYLHENSLSPQDLGLTHRSLRVRILILQLDELLNGKKKKGLFG